MTSSDQIKGEAIMKALTTLVSEEAEPHLSSLTPNILDREEYNRLSNICQRLDPDGANQPAAAYQRDSGSILQGMTPADTTPTLNAADQSMEQQPDSREKRGLSLSSHIETPLKRRPGRPRKEVNLEHDTLTSQAETPARRRPGRPRKDVNLEPETSTSQVETPEKQEPSHLGIKVVVPQTRPSNSWNPLSDIKDIQLDLPFEEHLKSNPHHNARRFLDACALKFESTATNEAPTTKDLVQLCIRLGQPPDLAMDNVRWLFEALVIGDMGVLLFESTAQDYSSLLTTTSQKIQDAAADFDANDTTYLRDTMNLAYSVEFIGQHFGTGSLFWLRPILTQDFLRKIDITGLACRETLDNFRKRDFDSRIQQSGANTLGDAVRTHLRSIHNINRPGNRSDTRKAEVILIDDD